MEKFGMNPAKDCITLLTEVAWGSHIDRLMMAIDAYCGLLRFRLTMRAVKPHRCEAVQNPAFGTKQFHDDG